MKSVKLLQIYILHTGRWINTYLQSFFKTSCHFFSCDSIQDLISMTLMNGRALLLCDVGVSGLLCGEEK